MHTDNWVWFGLVFFFLGDGLFITVTFFPLLPFAVSVMADFHFFPPLEPQQEGQLLMAWETPKPLSGVCISGIGG